MTEMSENSRLALENFPTDGYFDRQRPFSWQQGNFAKYCYGHPDFPSFDKKNERKRAVFNLWKQALENIARTEDAEKRDTALKLMEVSISPH